MDPRSVHQRRDEEELDAALALHPDEDEALYVDENGPAFEAPSDTEAADE